MLSIRFVLLMRQDESVLIKHMVFTICFQKPQCLIDATSLFLCYVCLFKQKIELLIIFLSLSLV